jgi:16S rRNA C967 or C1407 C5-methylase (RsmB/RsmF family)
LPPPARTARQRLSRLRPGGTLVYSTCTLNREENENVMQLIETYPDAVEFLPLGDLFHRPNAPDAGRIPACVSANLRLRRFLRCAFAQNSRHPSTTCAEI